MSAWTETFPNATANTQTISFFNGNMPLADNNWTMFGIDVASSTTIPAGGGGLTRIEAVADNRLANWGREQSRFDSGTLRFKVGRRNTGDPTSARYGVHFQTNQGDGKIGSNSGFIVIVQSSDGSVKLGSVNGTQITYLLTTTPPIAKNEYVEVVWGPRGITGELKYINVYKYDVNLANRTLLLSDNPSTLWNPGGGRIGVCAAASAVDVAVTPGDLWITEFFFQDTLRKLADYGSTTSGSGANTYKNVAGRLYEDPPGTHTNSTPDVIRNRGLAQAQNVRPLLVTTPNADPVTVDLVRGMIGLVNIGISNSGDFFAALLAKANVTPRNAAVTRINAAEHARLTTRTRRTSAPGIRATTIRVRRIPIADRSSSSSNRASKNPSDTWNAPPIPCRPSG